MLPIAPLPASIRSRLGQNTHPGLLLDKYVESWDPSAQIGKLSERVQKPAIQSVADLSQHAPAGLDFASLTERRYRLLTALDAQTWRCTTTAPLTLHLARASALENAGICLHPLYGFVYLPGTGLKGMSHAYACEVWLPTQPQPNRKTAWDDICRVFGWAPSQWLRDLAERLEVTVPKESQAGAIVFHDAWPHAKWPRLIVDIVNNHHPAYYQDKPDSNNHPPGDWENPVPVYFLAVEPETTFTFAVSKRRQDDNPESKRFLALAREWLLGALCHLGAGAKTNAGYGVFKPAGDTETALTALVERTWKAATTPDATRTIFETTLELVTPAFFAGAHQEADDCDLRPATLRGHLRWWWRTMHAGFVDVATMRQMEAAIFGSTEAGGAVRITVKPLTETAAVKYDKQKIAEHNSLPMPPNNETTQGLWYHSYGMDERKAGQRHQRFYIPSGARWIVTLTARQSRYPVDAKLKTAKTIPCDLVLEQARSSLWLLCHLGGIGSKSRRGFGSLLDLPRLTLAECKTAAEGFRAACGLSGMAFKEDRAASHSLEQIISVQGNPTAWLEFPITEGNPWLALDRVGSIAQAFAQVHKHNQDKKALGLPRKIHGPPHQEKLYGPKGDRHASPVFYHVARGQNGLVIRVTAFPASALPDLPTSQKILGELLAHIHTQLAPSQPAPQPRPVIKPIGKGQEPIGTLKRKDDTWVALFDGENREAILSNAAKVPEKTADGSKAKFFIEKASKREGILARFERLL